MITNRGYIVSQDSFKNVAEKKILINDLTVVPIDMSNMGKGSGDSDGFPIYRENPTKFYTPRFYGLNKWGVPSVVKLPLGDAIDVAFKGDLRPIQVPIVAKTITHFHDNGPTGKGGALLELYCAIGKTVCALNMISQLGRKTIIIVHKEFLMNQWIERAREFIPGARIGKIQGPLFDIEDKDIVIGMVQSMYDRDFPTGAFDSFGFAIFDEVHRFGSRQFSSIFWRINTYHMLGITATINRKDGTTPLLSQFIGPVIYTITDRGKETVTVLGITYTDDKRGGVDAPYLKQEVDFRGNVKYSTMIANVCNYKPRTAAIYTIITNILQKYPTSQIMILAHNLCLLGDMETIIKERNPMQSYGFYIGGMKKKALMETETKQIVLATYSMAAEALDIKTLNCLILASSKTDIIQSVGRILRDKGENPKIVVDIIDPAGTFENQWKKRLAYYKKCDYTVFKCGKWAEYMAQPNQPFATFNANNGTNKTTTGWKQLFPKPPPRNKTNKTNCKRGDVSDDDDDDDKKMSSNECLIQL